MWPLLIGPIRYPPLAIRLTPLEFAATPWSQTHIFSIRHISPGKVPTRQNNNDGPQVFRSLSDGARVHPRLVGAQPCGVLGVRGGVLDHHRPLRLPRSETGAGAVF